MLWHFESNNPFNNGAWLTGRAERKADTGQSQTAGRQAELQRPEA